MAIAGGTLDGSGLKALEMLVAARAAGEPCAPVRGLLPDGDVDAAYAVQSAWVAGQIAAGARVVGRKIGLARSASSSRDGQHDLNGQGGRHRLGHHRHRPPAGPSGRPAEAQ